MPDILIRGMELPTKGYKTIILHSNGRVYEPTSEELIVNKIADATELPPHGDLIDRDEAISVLKNIGSRDYRREKGTICDAIKMISHDQYVPVIISAEKGE